MMILSKYQSKSYKKKDDGPSSFFVGITVQFFEKV